MKRTPFENLLVEELKNLSPEELKELSLKHALELRNKPKLEVTELTNSEIAMSQEFRDFCNVKGIESSKRQVSKRKEEFKKWLDIKKKEEFEGERLKTSG